MSVSRGCGDEEQPVVLRGGRESSELSNSKPSRSTKEQRIYLKCWKVHIYFLSGLISSSCLLVDGRLKWMKFSLDDLV